MAAAEPRRPMIKTSATIIPRIEQHLYPLASKFRNRSRCFSEESLGGCYLALEQKLLEADRLKPLLNSPAPAQEPLKEIRAPRTQ